MSKVASIRGVLSDVGRAKRGERSTASTNAVLRRLSGVSNGWSSAALHRVLNHPRRHPGLRHPELHALRVDGIAFPDWSLSTEQCDELVALARCAPAAFADAEGASATGTFEEAGLDWPLTTIDPAVVASHAVVAALAVDSRLLEIATAYLGRSPIVGPPVLWWSSPSTRPFGAADYVAQQFHSDFDGLKWLKVFFYLTDVNSSAGPHCFVRGTHLHDREGWGFRRRGSLRYSAEEMEAVYGDRVLEVCGPAGTVFLEDTAGFHRGLPPVDEPRLVLQFQYLASLFGNAG